MMAARRQARPTVRFGAFEVDFEAGELRKHGLVLKLAPQPFQLLALLLERPGEVITREEIQKRLWSDDTIVDFDHSLGTAVNKLRAALGDSASHPRYIDTLPRRGYRFLAPAQEISRSTSDRRVRWRYAALAAAMLLVAVVAAYLAGRQGSPDVYSIAVLPLENLSGDPDQEYFCDGMTDALITELAAIGALDVRSRTSVMPLKRNGSSLPDIARELNVDYVLEGAALSDGPRVRITVQLIEASGDRHLLSETFEGDLVDSFTLQKEVALAIARKIQVRLSPEEEAVLKDPTPVNSEAYIAYLRGQHLLEQMSPSAFATGMSYFRQAVRDDQDLALAFVGLSMGYRLAVLGGSFSGRTMVPLAMEAAEKAVVLEPDLAEGHFALGASESFRWNWDVAERELRRAIELNPALSWPHHAYGLLCLTPQGRLNEALQEIEKAVELNPVSHSHNSVYGAILYYSGQHDRARRQLDETLALAPRYMPAFLYLGRVNLVSGSYDEAITSSREAEPIGATGALQLAYAHAVAGNAAEARRMLADAAHRPLICSETMRACGLPADVLQSEENYASPVGIATVHIGLREIDLAFEWLERAFEERDKMLAYLKVDPVFRPLRGDPRYVDLLRRMKLEP